MLVESHKAGIHVFSTCLVCLNMLLDSLVFVLVSHWSFSLSLVSHWSFIGFSLETHNMSVCNVFTSVVLHMNI